MIATAEQRLTMDYPVPILVRPSGRVIKDAVHGHHVPGTPTEFRHGWLAGAEAAKAVEGDAALDVPPVKLEKLTADGDRRAASLWYRNGDNSDSLPEGVPGYRLMGNYMRDPDQTSREEEMDRRIAEIDQLMGESRLPQPIVVWRGISRNALKEAGWRRSGGSAGIEFVDHSFLSTTTDQRHAGGFGLPVKIRVPAGVGAIRMSERSADRSEKEILLDRNLRIRIVAEHPMMLEAEVVPHGQP